MLEIKEYPDMLGAIGLALDDEGVGPLFLLNIGATVTLASRAVGATGSVGGRLELTRSQLEVLAAKAHAPRSTELHSLGRDRGSLLRALGAELQREGIELVGIVETAEAFEICGRVRGHYMRRDYDLAALGGSMEPSANVAAASAAPPETIVPEPGPEAGGIMNGHAVADASPTPEGTEPATRESAPPVVEPSLPSETWVLPSAPRPSLVGARAGASRAPAWMGRSPAPARSSAWLWAAIPLAVLLVLGGTVALGRSLVSNSATGTAAVRPTAVVSRESTATGVAPSLSSTQAPRGTSVPAIAPATGAVPAVSSTSAPQGGVAAPSAGFVVTQAQDLRLRSQPSTTAQILADLPIGTNLRVVGTSVTAEGFEWLPVQTNGGTSGWVVSNGVS